MLRRRQHSIIPHISFHNILLLDFPCRTTIKHNMTSLEFALVSVRKIVRLDTLLSAIELCRLFIKAAVTIEVKVLEQIIDEEISGLAWG